MEEMHFQYSESRAQLIKGVFRLSRESKDALLEQYAFSNATALSVKLAVLESSLNSYIDGIQFITEDMKNGNRVSLNREQVFRKTGGLYALRHHINLRSDLLDTPDFYWDRQDLEKLFTSTCLFLNISKRTKVMNEKLNYCTELMALLSHHLNDIHHVRLEWMIIILIMVEVRSIGFHLFSGKFLFCLRLTRVFNPKFRIPGRLRGDSLHRPLIDYDYFSHSFKVFSLYNLPIDCILLQFPEISIASSLL